MGGNAFSNVKPIKKEHIEDTVNSLIRVAPVGSDYQLLGSAGKKPVSGDLDIAVNLLDPDKQFELFKQMKKLINDHDVRRFGGNISFPWTVPATGEQVQIDFIFGDPEWLSFYYHSPSAAESKFKGTHRNVAISALASMTDRQELSADVNPDGNCVDTIRWKWSAKTGLSRIRRKYNERKEGNGYAKTAKEEQFGESLYAPADIARVLFKGKYNDKYLTSLESILDAIDGVYGNDDPEFTEQIYQRMAKYFQEHHDLKKYDWDYPPEIKRHVK